jgi:hypothetical protein
MCSYCTCESSDLLIQLLKVPLWMKALACRLLRVYCHLHLQIVLLQNWVPWCTYHVFLYCGTYYVKVTTFHSCSGSIFLRSWSFFGGAVVVPSGEAVVAVLPVSLSLSSTCQIHYGLLPLPSSTETSPTTPRHPLEGSSFALSYSLFSLNWSMYVILETRYDFVYYIAVM